MANRGSMLIQGANMVLPTGIVIGDLRIRDGIISEIIPGGGSTPDENEIFFDATGLHLLPGIIDPQVHFREPGGAEKEDLQTGSAAAASGGVTTFLDMPNNNPPATTLESIQEKIESASNKCVTNYGFFIGATPDNLAELQRAVGTPENPLAIPGICGIKIFMGSSTGTLLVSEKRHLEEIFAGTAGLIAVHAEDEQRLNDRFEQLKHRSDMAAHAEWRDSECALLATQLAVGMAQKHSHRLHILHLTSGLEADWLAGITNQEEPLITTETLPQHLTFDERDVEKIGTRLKMNPPIRYSEDREILWNRLHDGTIACIATDHAPHTLEKKSDGWPSAPSGMPGVESSLPVMLTHASEGRCTIESVVKWMSTNVADCYAMAGKGSLEIGNDGDIVLVDMNNHVEVRDENTWSRVGWNPFAGRSLTGWPVLTVVSGIAVFERTQTTGQKGRLLVSPGEIGEAVLMSPWN